MVKDHVVPHHKEDQYEVLIYWDELRDWVLWQTYIDLGNAEPGFNYITKTLPDAHVFLFDRWENKVLQERRSRDSECFDNENSSL